MAEMSGPTHPLAGTRLKRVTLEEFRVKPPGRNPRHKGQDPYDAT